MNSSSEELALKYVQSYTPLQFKILQWKTGKSEIFNLCAIAFFTVTCPLTFFPEAQEREFF